MSPALGHHDGTRKYCQPTLPSGSVELPRDAGAG